MEEAIIVAEGTSEVPDFPALQDALATGRTNQLIFYAFDILYLDGTACDGRRWLSANPLRDQSAKRTPKRAS